MDEAFIEEYLERICLYVIEHREQDDYVGGPGFTVDSIQLISFVPFNNGWKALIDTDLPDGKMYMLIRNSETEEVRMEVYRRCDTYILERNRNSSHAAHELGETC